MSYTDAQSRVLIVDGVSHTAASVRRLLHERHLLADENRRLHARLSGLDVHLQRRTSALVRLIAAKGPRL